LQKARNTNADIFSFHHAVPVKYNPIEKQNNLQQLTRNQQGKTVFHSLPWRTLLFFLLPCITSSQEQVESNYNSLFFCQVEEPSQCGHT